MYEIEIVYIVEQHFARFRKILQNPTLFRKMYGKSKDLGINEFAFLALN